MTDLVHAAAELRAWCDADYQRDEGAQPDRHDRFIGLSARMEVMAQMGEAGGEVRAAVHGDDEGAADGPATNRPDRIVEAALVERQLVTLHVS
jgi:hypothetical protein